jgi:predicted metal-binding protein
MAEKALDLALSNPLVEAASLIKISEIQVKPWVRDACRVCQYHGKSWSCPPATGSLDKASKQLSTYKNAIFLKLRTFRDRSVLEKSILDLEKTLKSQGFPRAQGFFVSPCTACKSCSYPNPCPTPDKCRPTGESWGIDLISASRTAGLGVGKVRIGEEFSPVTLILLE